jgi:DNA-binding MarR family transcriptional regulator
MDRNVAEATMPATVPQALGHLRVALEDAYTQASRGLGLTAQQAELLCAALRPAAVGDLARVLRCDRSNISRLVDRAAAHDLLRRRCVEEDGRVTMIELTPTGRRLAERFLERLESQIQTILAEWTDQRRRTATGILNEIADALDEAAGSGRPRTR